MEEILRPFLVYEKDGEYWVNMVNIELMKLGLNENYLWINRKKNFDKSKIVFENIKALDYNVN